MQVPSEKAKVPLADLSTPTDHDHVQDYRICCDVTMKSRAWRTYVDFKIL
jgi:hypothetical protein